MEIPAAGLPAQTIPVQNLGGKTWRVESIDLLRGLVMILMALDHVRDYFHIATMYHDPTDLAQTNPALFFTRFITHYCAPVFMLLSGTSAYLVGKRKGKKALSKFLLTRGAWLIFLEFTVIAFGWYFNFPSIDLVVIWALGISMIILSLLIYLPIWLILTLGLVMVLGHNLLDSIKVPGNGADAVAWSILHQSNFFDFKPLPLFVGYPIIPWAGVMAIGYCLGQLYTRETDPAKRKQFLLWTGIGSVLLFFILRLINVYGDPIPWSRQSEPIMTVLSFFNVYKYPPSLLYLLITLGPALIFLALTEKVNSRLSNMIRTIGRVPMFYYIIHLYLIHILAALATLLVGFSPSDMILDDWIAFEPQLKGYGFSLFITYLVWAFLVVIVYFLCRWYDRYKRTHHYWWLSYL